MGTVVHQGSALGVVVRSGARTAFGQIAAGLSEKQSRTAFEIGLSRFSRLLFGWRPCSLGYLHRQRGAVTAPHRRTALLTGDRRRHRPRDDARHRDGQPRAGSEGPRGEEGVGQAAGPHRGPGNIEILFTDKTGTLTEGAITFERGLAADGQESDRPLLFGLVCNEATVTDEGPVGGNALDQALWSAPGGVGGEIATSAVGYVRQGVLPFDHERQLVSVLVKDPSGKPLLITKGAPEVVLERCVNVPDGARQRWRHCSTKGPGGGRGHPSGR